jgi:uncharacterized protein YecE (DUF72 family)
MMRIGTSGFSYDDWIGSVYPDGLPAREQLSFYATLFSTVEINVTYYRIPATNTVTGWVRKTPDDFLFAIKAYGELTHQRESHGFAGFVEAIRPIAESGKLGCVLAQFPYSFHPTEENADYLRRLRAGFGDLPVVVEFRNAGWVKDETFDLLRSENLGYCCVDEPRLKGLLPPIAVATSAVAYVRFHGRNYAKWYAHEEAWERYNYTSHRTQVCNVLIIGTGGAGLRAALAATEAGVGSDCRGQAPRRDAHTVLAAGGINAALATVDPRTPGSTISPTPITRATGSPIPGAVEILVREAPEHVLEMAEWGCDFARCLMAGWISVFRRAPLPPHLLRGRLHRPRHPLHARRPRRAAQHSHP